MSVFLGIVLAALAFGPVLQFLGNVRLVWWRRVALLGVLLLIGRYAYWRLTQTVPWGHLSSAAVYMQVLALVELAWLMEFIHAHCFFWSPGRRKASSGPSGMLAAGLDRASVDIFIPTYNESAEILERTVLAAQRIRWDGKVTISVLDDGGRASVGELCRKMGVRWITRPDNRGAKAGNINNALRHTDGDVILILDADFLAHPDAIQRLMPAFDDPKVAVAQAAQHFYNQDPIMRALGTAKYFGDDQRLFFDRILPARDRGGFAFFCGTCALLRRAPLMEAGGLPSGSVTEDILLSVHLRQRGYETRFVDTRVATGLAAESLHAFFVQRCRWARGGIQLLYLRTGLLARGLALRDRIAFLPVYWIVSPIVRTSSLVVPQLYLLLAWVPLQHATVGQLLVYQGPLLVAMVGLPAFLYPRRWSPLVNFVWGDVLALRLFPSVLRDIFFPFGDMRFHVTPKGRSAGSAAASEDWMGVAVAAGVIFTLIALIVGPFGRWDDPYVSVSMLWAALNLMRLLAILAVLWGQTSEVGDAKIEVRCGETDGFLLLSEARSARSLAGWWISEDRLRPPPGAHPASESAASRLARRSPDGRTAILAQVQAGGLLHFVNEGARASLLSMLVALHVDKETPYQPAKAARRVAAQMFGFARSVG
jgi:cellulose synthase (UDP-forming)